MTSPARRLVPALLAACLLVLSVTGQAAEPRAYEKEPAAHMMVGDLVLTRPLLLVGTVLGGVAFVASLPFTLPSRSVDSAGETLFLKPARATFTRCLGCPVEF
ncbi:multidrug transporter [Alkalilimnicola sp. S0819]|uniref:multidrug transporter n=1 Tax=Alkalilimnicola sp. S0819 TaxID=2613922 RepID=UPI0012627944|nr:multidrug transporter [Alkalilimnicola sp. S0819]KAB7623906.1 multidrug transporter [Alkalilimnicola sp. S0819]MPQ16501.1 multidrug transporter [Alkalilimnicola sp. S0819]